jgi:Ca2+-binding RTX toxin-like protein
LIGAPQNTGGAGTDTLSGFENLTGSDFHDALTGDGANNALMGGAGNDRLVGGLGRDILTGGNGADDYDFNAVTETGTTAATRDQIIGFAPASDDIDLSTIDANTLIGGNQAFAFIGAAAFSGTAGELRSVAGANTIVMGDVNGDSTADFHIQINGNFALTAASFVL